VVWHRCNLPRREQIAIYRGPSRQWTCSMHVASGAGYVAIWRLLFPYPSPAPVEQRTCRPYGRPIWSEDARRHIHRTTIWFGSWCHTVALRVAWRWREVVRCVARFAPSVHAVARPTLSVDSAPSHRRPSGMTCRCPAWNPAPAAAAERTWRRCFSELVRSAAVDDWTPISSRYFTTFRLQIRRCLTTSVLRNSRVTKLPCLWRHQIKFAD